MISLTTELHFENDVYILSMMNQHISVLRRTEKRHDRNLVAKK